MIDYQNVLGVALLVIGAGLVCVKVVTERCPALVLARAGGEAGRRWK
jgi:hypothetical protein